MQKIIAAGGTVDSSSKDGYHYSSMANKYSSKGKTYTHAALLSEAKGDLDEALELAYRHKQKASYRLFLEAGAGVEKLFAQEGKKIIDWQLDNGLLEPAQLHKMLEKATESKSQALLNILNDWDVVFSALDSMTDRSTESITSALKSLMAAGFSGQALMSKLVQRYVDKDYRESVMVEGIPYSEADMQKEDVKAIKSLIALGISATDELVKQASRPKIYRSSDVLEDMVKTGADYRAVFALEGQRYFQAKSNLVEPVVRYLIEDRALTQDQKLSELKALIRAVGEEKVRSAANQGLLWQLRSQRSTEENQSILDGADVLFRAGVLPDYSLLQSVMGDLYETLDFGGSVVDHIAKSVKDETLEHQLLLRALRTDRGNLTKLIVREEEEVSRVPTNPSYAVPLKRHTQRLQYITEVALRGLLSRIDLSAQDKVTALSQWLTSHTAAEFAANLLKDAVYSAKAATVKLLVLAGVDATPAFVSLARDLEESQVWHREPRVRLLVQNGADYQPAIAALNAQISAHLKRGDAQSAEADKTALSRLERTIRQVIGVGLASQ